MRRTLSFPISIKTELSLYVRDAQGNPIIDIVPQEFETPAKLSLLEKKNLDLTPQLKILNYEVEKLQINEKLNNQSKLPGLNLELLGSRELSRNRPYDPESLQIGVKFDLPFENRKATGKAVATQYKLKAIERQRIFTYQELNRYYDMTLAAIEIGVRRWETTSREYENTVIMAEAEKKRWIQGATDLFIVNLREQDSAESDVKRWTSLYEYHQSTLDAQLYSASF